MPVLEGTSNRARWALHYTKRGFLEIAKAILSRETVKEEAAQKWLAFADLKRKFPMLNDKLDEELLIDKERPVKKPDPK